MWLFEKKRASGFSASSTAEDVTKGLDGTGLTAIVTEQIKMWLFEKKRASGFSASSTAEDVTKGLDGTGLTAIVTGCHSLECTKSFTLDNV
nr:short-chain dehydrogenase TIC 32, chloroplastic [Tanacetum cinerariifolium]